MVPRGRQRLGVLRRVLGVRVISLPVTAAPPVSRHSLLPALCLPPVGGSEHEDGRGGACSCLRARVRALALPASQFLPPRVCLCSPLAPGTW